ncbi:MAG TPA: hypothetical protein VF194_14515 [Ferrovibrio sp.]|uniref:hypothetical protein n=1 Tax=Ferrovibrio sp. TaxID=1917215 RepID=UPI002ED0D42B
MDETPGREADAAEQEFLSFGWEAASFTLPGAEEGQHAAAGFRKGDFGAFRRGDAWVVLAVPARLVLGQLPSVSAVRRFVAKSAGFPAQPNGAIIGAARQAMLQAVEEELSLARQAAQQLEAKIDDLMGSIDDIRAKAILFSRDDERDE